MNGKRRSPEDEHGSPPVHASSRADSLAGEEGGLREGKSRLLSSLFLVACILSRTALRTPLSLLGHEL